MTKQLRAFGYARASSNKAQYDGAIECQVEAIRNWCERENVELISIFEEPVAAGSDGQRKELNRMVAQARSASRPIDAIVVWSCSRLSRSPEQLLNSTLRNAGFSVLSLTEQRAGTSTWQLMCEMIATLSEN